MGNDKKNGVTQRIYFCDDSTCREKGGPTLMYTRTYTRTTFQVLRSLAQILKKARLIAPPTLPLPSQDWNSIGEDSANKLALSHQHK